MSANDRQVGGTHYKSEYIHWDLIIRTWGPGYLIGNATKYIARANKKGSAVQDLDKALHYIEKLLENVTLAMMFRPNLTQEYLFDEAQRFCQINELDTNARQAVMMLITWKSANHLQLAYDATYRLKQLAEMAKPVPLSDSNKHAPRA